MALTYIGEFAILGVDGLVDVSGVIVAANFQMTGASMTDGGTTVFEHKNSEGQTVGFSAAGREQAATFTVTPLSTTAAGTADGSGEDSPATELDAVKATLVFPLPLATVAITGFGTTTPDLIKPFTGNWAYVGGSITFNADGGLSMTLNCERYNEDPNTQTIFTP